MDKDLFTSAIRYLLHINVMRLGADRGGLALFEEKFCYRPELQPAFTACRLAELLDQTEGCVLYDVGDEMDFRVCFFRLDDELFLVGPFVRSDFDLMKTEQLLARHGIPASYAASIKLYHSAFPLISTTSVRNALLSLIRAFSNSSEDYTICHTSTDTQQISVTRPNYSEPVDYQTLYQRYDLENRFLRMIESGDTENVLIAYREMHMNGLSQNRYVNAIYQDPIIAVSMLRALARKAAEHAGVSIVEINEITQRSVQKLLAAKHLEEQLTCTREMILELTQAVQRHRYHTRQYSAPIQRVTEYLRLNFSQENPIPRLAELAGISVSYLSRQFKKETGRTISQHLAHLRCMRAAELLKESELSIQDISSYVGYIDNNYFVKVFRKEYGMTPTDYREKEG